MTEITLEDIMILARTIYGEARGSSEIDRLAVAHVMLNRWRDPTRRRDHTLAATCLRYKQFSAWNKGDPNRVKMQGVTVDDRAFRLCLLAALEAIDGADPTSTATHYHTPAVSPRWAKDKTPCFTTKSHLFYNDVK